MGHRDRSVPSEAAVETRPARPQHQPLIDQFCKTLIKHHVLASPQSHRATISPHGVAGSCAARWRVCLASWGWLPIPRRQGQLRTNLWQHTTSKDTLDLDLTGGNQAYNLSQILARSMSSPTTSQETSRWESLSDS